MDDGNGDFQPLNSCSDWVRHPTEAPTLKWMAFRFQEKVFFWCFPSLKTQPSDSTPPRSINKAAAVLGGEVAVYQKKTTVPGGSFKDFWKFHPKMFGSFALFFWWEMIHDPIWRAYFANLGGGFRYFFFHPYLGKWSNLTNIFQMGWNHQLEMGWFNHQLSRVVSFKPKRLQ